MNFFSKSFFSIWYLVWAKIFPPLSKNFQQNCQNWISCVQLSHFDQNIMLTLWNNFRLWARKCLICGGKIAALLSIILFCLQMGNWKNSCERIFTFSDFFWRSREYFMVFSLYHSRHGGPNWIPPAKRNISIRKNFRENLLSFPDYGRNFLNFHWRLLGMVVKTTVYVFRGALWEGFQTMSAIF